MQDAPAKLIIAQPSLLPCCWQASFALLNFCNVCNAKLSSQEYNSASMQQLCAIDSRKLEVMSWLVQVSGCEHGKVDVQKIFGPEAKGLVAHMNTEGQHRGAVAAAKAAAAAKTAKKEAHGHEHHGHDCEQCNEKHDHGEHGHELNHGHAHDHGHNGGHKVHSGHWNFPIPENKTA